MAEKVLRRRDQAAGSGLRAVLAVQSGDASPIPIPGPPEDADAVKANCDSFLLESFTVEDAWELGHLLYARLLPFSAQKPTLISIALANSDHVLFQCAVGSGTAPDNELWVQRKRNTVLRFGTSTWLQHCKFAGDEEAFRVKFGMSPVQAENYAIHGGGVPIRVKGVEGIVAVVVVSGLKQHEDHGVIVDVIKHGWE
ncbi:hypothetical protein F4820DRAFT_419786 [Hypoxylon rubiginosum]|uniref:Uncharacterized protein n=1 Tax=Hypoxylon rubiginosum TaxID=110542 RepID=A0ACB9Z3J9_9PEZI|nr:hypothetical protein F4820DRAFT_419786 [Hypoxylon rubiginosum]